MTPSSDCQGNPDTKKSQGLTSGGFTLKGILIVTGETTIFTNRENHGMDFKYLLKRTETGTFWMNSPTGSISSNYFFYMYNIIGGVMEILYYLDPEEEEGDPEYDEEDPL